MTSPTLIDSLSAHLFWDTDPASVDPEQHRAFIIARVMDRGTMQDVKATWEFYGEAAVREALLAAPSLDKKTIAFFANQFDLPRERFRSYRNDGMTWKS